MGQAATAGVAILDAGMIDGHTLRVKVTTPDFGANPVDPPQLELDAWPAGVHAHGSLLLMGMPPHVPIPIDVDLSKGTVNVGLVRVGEFPPSRGSVKMCDFPCR